MTLELGIAVLYTLTALSGYLFLEKKEAVKVRSPLLILIFILLAGFVLRIYFAMQDESFYWDLNLFKQWADIAADYGLKNMYHMGIYLDYPPGLMYILRILHMVKDTLGLSFESQLWTCLVKMPSIVIDLCAVVFLYTLASRHLNTLMSLFLSACYCFAPAVIFDSSVWGQVDSFLAFFIVLCLYFAGEKKTILCAVTYAVALFCKPQALLFGPVLLFYILETKSLKEFFKAVGAGLGSIWFMALPFSQGLSPLWLISLYKDTYSQYPSYCKNAFNLYMALGLNEVLYEGFPETAINYVVIGGFFLLCGWAFFRIKGKGKFFLISGVFIGVFFTFCTMMHERYVYPAFILFLAASVLLKEKKLFFVYLAMQTANHLNQTEVFSNGIYDIPFSKPIYLLSSILMITSCVYSIFLMVQLAAGTRRNEKVTQ